MWEKLAVAFEEINSCVDSEITSFLEVALSPQIHIEVSSSSANKVTFKCNRNTISLSKDDWDTFRKYATHLDLFMTSQQYVYTYTWPYLFDGMCTSLRNNERKPDSLPSSTYDHISNACTQGISNGIDTSKDSNNINRMSGSTQPLLNVPQQAGTEVQCSIISRQSEQETHESKSGSDLNLEEQPSLQTQDPEISTSEYIDCTCVDVQTNSSPIQQSENQSITATDGYSIHHAENDTTQHTSVDIEQVDCPSTGQGCLHTPPSPTIITSEPSTEQTLPITFSNRQESVPSIPPAQDKSDVILQQVNEAIPPASLEVEQGPSCSDKPQQDATKPVIDAPLLRRLLSEPNASLSYSQPKRNLSEILENWSVTTKYGSHNNGAQADAHWQQNHSTYSPPLKRHKTANSDHPWRLINIPEPISSIPTVEDLKSEASRSKHSDKKAKRKYSDGNLQPMTSSFRAAQNRIKPS